eukprot:m51a1_g10220 hypothetical protein (535) ;mRNA; f:124230-127357
MPAALALQQLARMHARTLRSLHVYCYCWEGGYYPMEEDENPFSTEDPTDPDNVWGFLPTNIAVVGDAVARGLAEGYVGMDPQGRAPLQSLVFESMSAEAVLLMARSAPGGALPNLEELVGLRSRTAQWLPYTDVHLKNSSVKLLAAVPGPFPLVTHLVTSMPHCLPIMESLAEHFPNVVSLEVLDEFRTNDDAASPASIVRGLLQLTCLRELSWVFAQRSVQIEAAALTSIRKLAIDGSTGRNLWAAVVPGMLGRLEELDVQLSSPGVTTPNIFGVIVDYREGLHFDVSQALKHLKLCIFSGLDTVPRASSLIAELLIKGTGLVDATIICELDFLPSLANVFKVLPEGIPRCPVTFELWSDEVQTRWLKCDAEYELVFDASEKQASSWVFTITPEIPFREEIHIITSRDTLLQTNKKLEIKHFHKTPSSDPKTKWIIEPAGGYAGRAVCIKNVGSGKYMMTPKTGVETWNTECGPENGMWELTFGGVDDKRGTAWSIRSHDRGTYLVAYGDDENRVNVNREVADTWEHFLFKRV